MKRTLHASAGLSGKRDTPERLASGNGPDENIETLDADGYFPQDDDIRDDDIPEADEDSVIDVGDAVPSSGGLPLPVGGKDGLHLYIREISRFPLLKPDEEFHLARRVREHDDSEAAFRLISSHLRLVVKIAMDFQRRWMQNVLDLIQEGNVGLMRAVNKFDPEKGIKFSYYAAFWIKAYILKFIMDNWRMVKIGTTQTQRKLFYNLSRERRKLVNEGFDPDAGMLSSRLGVSREQVEEMEQRLASADLSLDAKMGDNSNAATRMDFLPALGPGLEDGFATEEIAAIVRDSITHIAPKLSEKEAYILNRRLLSDEPVTLREIGERYNITRERVRQVETRLLQKLRQHFSDDIKDFSGEWIQS
jgi:RNA polymerase sigma-32 factor